MRILTDLYHRLSGLSGAVAAPLLARFRVVCIAIAVGLGLCAFGPILAVPVAAQSQSIDPSNVWFRAYTVMKEGEAMELSGDSLGALAKFNESKQLFDHVYHQHSEFHPEIVRYRRKELADKISALRQEMRQNNNGGQSGPVAAVPPQVSESGIVLPAPNPLQNGSPEFPAPIQPTGNATVVSPPYGSTADQGLEPAAADPNNPFAGLQQQYQRMKSEVDRLNKINQTLQQQLTTNRNELASYQNELAQARQREQALREEMKNNSDASPETVKQLKQQLTEAMQLAKEANSRSDQLLAELEVSKKEYAALKTERDRILRERDQYEAIMNQDAGKQQLAKLISENERLRDELASTREQAEQLRKQSGDKDIEIVKLKEQLQRIEQDRSQLLEDNALHQRHIAELQGHLKELGKGSLIGPSIDLAAITPNSPDADKAIAENSMLRDIVLRQLSRQNQLKQAKQALIEELEALGVESSSLLASIDDIIAGAGLTDDERNKIRKPSMADNAGPVDATIIVEGAEADGSGEGIVTVQSLGEELSQIQKAARLDYVEGNYPAAKVGYEKYLRLNPRSVEGTCNLAQVLLQLKDYSSAEQLLEKAIALDKDAGRPYYLLGIVFFQQGKMDEALSQLEQGLERNPENSRAHNYVGVICADHKGWRKRALESFTAAITCDAEFADPHFNLAVLYSGGEEPDLDKVREHYLKARGLGAERDGSIEKFLDTATASLAPASSTATPLVTAVVHGR
jgi:tetratricopeptide (TPR) repeat protein